MFDSRVTYEMESGGRRRIENAASVIRRLKIDVLDINNINSSSSNNKVPNLTTSSSWVALNVDAGLICENALSGTHLLQKSKEASLLERCTLHYRCLSAIRIPINSQTAEVFVNEKERRKSIEVY